MEYERVEEEKCRADFGVTKLSCFRLVGFLKEWTLSTEDLLENFILAVFLKMVLELL